MIEVREYLVSVEGMAEYVALTTQAAELRKSLVPLRLFSLPDTGGLLNRPLHMYVYKDAVERDVKRRNLAANKDWIEYLKHELADLQKAGKLKTPLSFEPTPKPES